MPERRTSREIESLIEELVQRLTEAVEVATAARARALAEELLHAATEESRAAQARAPIAEHEPRLAEPLPGGPPAPPQATPARRRRRAPAVAAESRAAVPVDPEEERRAAERARLRAILRPTPPTPPAPPAIAPSVRAAQEEGSLQALENEIRERLSSLPGLSPSRYTAQIAAWVGRVRLHQTGPDGERTRIASRIMFDKLRNLAWSMEAGPIEALNLSWSTSHWERYVQDNELIAATAEPRAPQPEPESDVWSPPG